MTKTEQIARERTVYDTIADQIGHRAFLMMGTRYKVGDGNSLAFDLRGCRTINKIKITLEPCDLYRVTFYKIKGIDFKIVSELGLVSADQLAAVIESKTQLRLSL